MNDGNSPASPVVARGYAAAALPAGSALAIGNFDGVHLGHRALIDAARGLAAERGGAAAVMTFDPHPAQVLAPDRAPPLLCTVARRIDLLGEAGVDHVIVQPFDRAFAGLTPERFVDDVLVEALGVAAVVVGYDFGFGSKRAGNTDTLRELCAAHGVHVRVIEAQELGEAAISSTRIRAALAEGDVARAATLLGRPFDVAGPVVRGAARGRDLGYPTANIAVREALVPGHGIYAAWADVPGEAAPVAAAVSIGTVPTFREGEAVSVEAFLLDFAGDLYGAEVRLRFVARLRAEERFASVEALVDQIARDVAQVRTILGAPERAG